eukprot:m.163658 g.163658  ORF g.163658 m.163658 type:complete len:128 (-) comp21039_c0_seq4:25-408(-)
MKILISRSILSLSLPCTHCSSLSSGKSSHKQIDLRANPVLRLYYESRAVLFIMCSVNEIFFMALYFAHFFSGPYLSMFGYTMGMWEWVARITFVPCAAKHFISVIQMVAAARNIGYLDEEEIRQRRG